MVELPMKQGVVPYNLRCGWYLDLDLSLVFLRLGLSRFIVGKLTDNILNLELSSEDQESARNSGYICDRNLIVTYYNNTFLHFGTGFIVDRENRLIAKYENGGYKECLSN